MGESSFQDTQKRLNELLKDFLLIDEKRSDYGSSSSVAGGVHADSSSDTAAPYELKRCVYCGRAENVAPITAGRFNENICLFCKQDLVQRSEHCQQIVDEVTHNMEYLFAAPWNKRVKIKECVAMKVLRRSRNWNEMKAPHLIKKLMGFLESKWKLGRPVWQASIQPNIVQVKMKSKRRACVFKIRTDTPSGVVTAEIVYAVIKDYLNPRVKDKTLNSECAAGLAAWYMIHYLCNMNYRQYGKYYHETLEERGAEGVDTYQELYQKKRPGCGRIVPLSWGISQVKAAENK